MRELASVAIAFLIIPILARKKVPIGVCIIASAVVMALIGGLGPMGMISNAAKVFTTPSTLKSIVVVGLIGVLGGLMKHYDLLGKIVELLTGIIPSKKAVIMMVPAMIGMLSVPGGAIMSAPFANELGEELELPPPKRAAINLVFRHINVFVMPYTTSMVLTATLVPAISIYSLIGLNAIFILLYFALGYFFFVKDAKTERSEPSKNMLSDLGKLLLYTSPIYTCVILNIVFGLEFYIGMLINIAIAFLLTRKDDFLSATLKSVDIKTMLAIIGVYFLQNVIGEFGGLTTLFTGMLTSGNILIGIIISCAFFGAVTGFMPVALGVALPIITMLPLSVNRILLYTYTAFVWSFVGYYFSPMHLCQLFTVQYMKVSIGGMYREYGKFILSLVIAFFATYYGFGLFLK